MVEQHLLDRGDAELGHSAEDVALADRDEHGEAEPRRGESPLDGNRARQHQAHRLALSSVFEFPWLIEKLTIAPIFTLGTGRPLNTLLTTDPNRPGAYPLTARPAGLARNTNLGPLTSSLDLRVMKTIPVMDERAVLQFGVESFNLTNHTNAERLSPYSGLPTYGRILESLPGRQVQFLVQFEY